MLLYSASASTQEIYAFQNKIQVDMNELSMKEDAASAIHNEDEEQTITLVISFLINLMQFS